MPGWGNGRRRHPELAAHERDRHAPVREPSLSGRDAEIARDVVPEIASRLEFLEEVGLGYLSAGPRPRPRSVGRRGAAHPPRRRSSAATCRACATCWTSRPSACMRATTRSCWTRCASSATRATRWWWWSTTRTPSAAPTTSSISARAPASAAGASWRRAGWPTSGCRGRTRTTGQLPGATPSSIRCRRAARAAPRARAGGAEQRRSGSRCDGAQTAQPAAT